MSPASGDPFDSTTTWASPLEHLLATSDQPGPSLEPMNSSGSLDGSVSPAVNVFPETTDPSATLQTYTEFQTNPVVDSTTLTQDVAPIQMSSDHGLPTIASVDTMFDPTNAAGGIHDEIWSATPAHDSINLFPEQAADHEPTTTFDAGGYTDPFAVS